MKKILMIFLVFCSFLMQAQYPLKSRIKASAQSKYSQIFLRWSVDNAEAWELTNRYGYTIERLEIIDNGFVKDYPLRLILNSKSIVPLEMDCWEAHMDTHNSVAIFAQALYGTDFEVELDNPGQDIFHAYNQTQQKQQRFELALLAADNYFTAACMGGLGWIDSTASSGKKYLYKIYTNVPDSLLQTDTALLWIGPEDVPAFPEIQGFFAESGDKSVFFKWNIPANTDVYNAYIIERSEKKKADFKSISSFPLSNFDQKNNCGFWLDSLPDNDKTFYYRIKGIDIFGSEGPPSNPVAVKGRKMYTNYPENLNMEENRNNQYILTWDFDFDDEKELQGFKLCNRSSVWSPVDTVMKKIKPKVRTVNVTTLLGEANYLSIYAVYKNGVEKSSDIYFYQAIDSIPPVSPQALNGTIDSNGIVKLFWQQSTDRDIYGYRVLRSNALTQDFVQITTSPVSDTFWFDTISTNTSKSVFYRVIAVDRRGNESMFSEVKEIRRPIRYPPTSPQFISINYASDTLSLFWINSSHEDVEKVRILYKDTTGNWQILRQQKSRFGKDSLRLKWLNQQSTQFFALQSVTYDSLLSPLSEPFQLAFFFHPLIPSLKATVDRDRRAIRLSWATKEIPGYSEIQLYRKREEEPLQLLKILESTANSYTDTRLELNTKYSYHIKIVNTDGIHSILSEAIQVDY